MRQATVRRVPEFKGWEARCRCGWWAFGPDAGVVGLGASTLGRESSEAGKRPTSRATSEEVERFVRANLDAHRSVACPLNIGDEVA